MIIVDEVVYVATDWWGFAATLVAGILTAIATMAAVIYTNLLFIMIITEFYFFREKMDLIFMMIDRNNFLKLAGCFKLKIRQILILMKLQ